MMSLTLIRLMLLSEALQRSLGTVSGQQKPSDMRLRERRSGSIFSSDRTRRSPPPHYSRSPRLPGPHLIAIPDHHLPAVITLMHPEEGTTQG
ncbi:hypothetical protein Tco_1023965 [Tanacetum coccineum]